MNGKLKGLMLTLACLAAAPVIAQEATDPAPPPAPAEAPQPAQVASPLPRVGGDTLTWLAMQKDPASQAADVRPVPGEVAEQVYQRYVNSFKFPIPEEFKRDSFVQQGSGGGS